MDDVPTDRHPRASPASGGGLEIQTSDRLARAAIAAEELCAALWEALREELQAPRARGREEAVADLAERLAQVCGAVADLAARAGSARGADRPDPGPPSGSRAAETLTGGTRAPLPEPPTGGREIAIHDARGEGPAAWVQAIGARLERHVRDALPFAVLLVEVVDVERLAQIEPTAEGTRLLAYVEGALRRELRPPDGIALESRGRWWLTVPRADARAAWNLAERLARAARGVADHRGVPLEVAIGVATCPEDGRDASTLAAHADVGLYAARAAGRPPPPERAG